MTKKGKMKISKVKRNNHTTNKMKKQGKLKLQRHRPKVQKQKQVEKPAVEYSSESDNESGEEWADMLDDEEQQYIMNRLAKQPNLLSNIPDEEKPQKRSSKRKQKKEKPPRQSHRESDSGAETDSGSELEEKYEKQLAERPVKKTKPLLPIKTKDGLVEQVEECEDTESEQEQDEEPPSKKAKLDESDSEVESQDSGMEGTAEEDGGKETISAVQLLAARRDRLAHEKLRIGALCSSLLESPEKKLKNFYPILYLMEDRLKDGALNLHSVRKLATLSAYEVFKDILPEYLIRHQDYSNVKLKKDTLALYKYEKELLEFYKRYLQRLEKATGVLRRKKGDNRQLDESTQSLALVSLQCMCGLLVARPSFNYATNIAQSVVPILDNRLTQASHIVTQACKQIFSEDKKGDITLVIVRLINQLVKRRGSRLRPAALECLLSLRVRGVDLSEQHDIQHKLKQEHKHKKRIINLSKKEKKRAKKLKEVERELLETEAQESEAARRKQLTEVTKTVFHIYFRLLKEHPGSALLSAALKGITKFSDVINVEYYCDLVSILSGLLRSEAVRCGERLRCCAAVLALVAGASHALNIDPATFHKQLYNDMILVPAGGSCEDYATVVEAMCHVSRGCRAAPGAVSCALAKRSASLAAAAPPHAALALLLVLHTFIQQCKPVSRLLELESECCGVEGWLEGGRGVGALTELRALRAHHHPAVRDLATHILRGELPPTLHKLTPQQVYEQYDGSKMSFKPAVPPPKRVEPSNKRSHAHAWAQPDFKHMCEHIEHNVDMNIT